MRVAAASLLLTITAAAACTGSPAGLAPGRPTPRPDASTSAPDPAGGPSSAEPRSASRPSLPCKRGVQDGVVGAEHTIVGEIFGRPLTAPPSPDHTNEILWRATQAGLGDLNISASLNGSQLRVQRRVEGGPGPSIINVPRAGCWTLSMTWPGGHDAVAIRYLRRADAAPAP